MHSVEQHFEKKDATVRATYDALLRVARRFGEVVEEPKKTSIHLVAHSAFAGVATRRNKLVLTIGPAAAMKAKIDAGAAFDVAIVTPPLLEALAGAGKIDRATAAVIARSGLAVSLRAGAAKPDVGTADALKQTLLAAKSIGLNGQGATRANA